MADDMEALLTDVADRLADCRRGLVFTGAGVSTESGLPDFRSPTGLWRRYNPSLFDFERYLTDPEARKTLWRFRMELLAEQPRPNPAHRAIARLEELGVVRWVVTQNIDGLHQAAGSTRVIELHGSKRLVECLSCGRNIPTEDALARVRAGEEDPPCASCGGLLKLTAVSFGQALPAGTLEAAMEASSECDFCMVVGSSLHVYPAAHVPEAAWRAGAYLVVLNQEPTTLESSAHVVLRGRAGEILPTLVAEVQGRLGPARG
jgi:NAD-dependent deacetylase